MVAMEEEVDIYYVYLKREDNDIDSRERRLKKTLEALKKSRNKPTPSTKPTEPVNKPTGIVS